jgi:hypothetical protein
MKNLVELDHAEVCAAIARELASRSRIKDAAEVIDVRFKMVQEGRAYPPSNRILATVVLGDDPA